MGVSNCTHVNVMNEEECELVTACGHEILVNILAGPRSCNSCQVRETFECASEVTECVCE